MSDNYNPNDVDGDGINDEYEQKIAEERKKKQEADAAKGGGQAQSGQPQSPIDQKKLGSAASKILMLLGVALIVIGAVATGGAIVPLIVAGAVGVAAGFGLSMASAPNTKKKDEELKPDLSQAKPAKGQDQGKAPKVQQQVSPDAKAQAQAIAGNSGVSGGKDVQTISKQKTPNAKSNDVGQQR